ncbi:hypothetical protein JL100_017995 [Skermanella mucosa]|uniref:hypothetical protein n=1 Tax=Skermanella mucosa TaxID=1789672 RepID=UPI00192AE4FA|nr:hypothetical protein [Skermanella mucosa]UEM18978.1 hypothetical protein JL100_017995 [Skermanella mucosa]
MSYVLDQQAEGLVLGARIELLEVDISSVVEGAPTYRFTPNVTSTGDIVRYNGFVWAATALRTSGMLYDGTGGLPRPTLELADVNGILMMEAMKYQDLVGCTVKRWITCEQYLDPNPNAAWGPEIFVVNKKIAADGTRIVLELASIVDQRNMVIPKRRMFRKEFPGLARTRPRG